MFDVGKRRQSGDRLVVAEGGDVSERRAVLEEARSLALILEEEA